MNTSESLLRAILATVARQAHPPSELVHIVAPKAGGGKQFAAYNMCDGQTPQSEIGRKTKLDKGSLSRSIARWIEAGIVIRIDPDGLPLHVYPLPLESYKSSKKVK